jgi:hypothetical protein
MNNTSKYRFERKYLVKNRYLDKLRQAFQPFIKPDAFAKTSPNGYPEYTVRSIYYDSFNLNAIDEKIGGLKERKKLRIRGYNHPDSLTKVFFEIKSKNGNKIRKNRALVPFQDALEIISKGLHEKHLKQLSEDVQTDLGRFLFHYHKNKMHEVNLIVYEREAYHSIMNNSVRITFDKNIRSQLYPRLNDLFNDFNQTYIWPDSFILEVKYLNAPMPIWIKGIIEEFKLETSALSKYAEGYLCHELNTNTAL